MKKKIELFSLAAIFTTSAGYLSAKAAGVMGYGLDAILPNTTVDFILKASPSLASYIAMASVVGMAERNKENTPGDLNAVYMGVALSFYSFIGLAITGNDLVTYNRPFENYDNDVLWEEVVPADPASLIDESYMTVINHYVEEFSAYLGCVIAAKDKKCIEPAALQPSMP